MSFRSTPRQEFDHSLALLFGASNLLGRSGLKPEQVPHMEVVQRTLSELRLFLKEWEELEFQETSATSSRVVFEVCGLVKRSLEPWCQIAQRRGVEFVFDVSSTEPVWVRGDAESLRRLLLRLISHALRTEQGKPCIRLMLDVLATDEQTVLSIALEGAAPYSDAGSLARLGATVRDACLEMSFRPTQPPETGTPERRQTSGARILVVGGDSPQRRVTESILRFADCRVESTDDSDEAQIMLAAITVDALVVDMPLNQALDLVNSLDPEAPTPALIYLASEGKPGDAELWRKAGGGAYLHVPLRGDDLIDALSATTVEQPESKVLVTRHSLAEQRLREARILVVDDMALNRSFTQRSLTGLGHLPILAKSGLEALERISRESFNLVLLDVEMPGMDGLETLQRIRTQSGLGSEVPVVAITGHSSEEMRRRCLQAGADDVLHKPVYPELLDEVVQRWAGKRVVRDRKLIPPAPRPPADLSQLDSQSKDPEIQSRFARIFLDDLESCCRKLREAHAAGDARELRAAAHSIAGSAPYLGAFDLQGKAQKLELAAQHQSVETLESMLSELEFEAFRTQEYLLQVLASVLSRSSGDNESRLNVELTAKSRLTPKQESVLAFHSFLNVVNVIVSELYYLSELVSDREGVKPLLNLFLNLGCRLSDPSSVFEALGQLDTNLENFWRDFDVAVFEEQGRLEVRQCRENLLSIFAVLRARADELLQRRIAPERWQVFSWESLSQSMNEFLKAVEKNSKGRYRIRTVSEGKEPNDYLVDLQIRSQDGHSISMPPVLQDTLRDLTANARKYTDPGGTIRILLEETSSVLRLSVEDDGRGIPSAEIPLIAEFGYRASNVQDLNTQGGGFGLTKALDLVLQNKGQMWVESGLGLGTKVVIQLPSAGR
jgi:CheY-like chemotaxis protein